MPSFIVKQFDTYPAWLMALSDEDGWIALSPALGGVKFVGQLQGGTTMIGPGTMVLKTEVNFTANTSAMSSTLTNVSSFTGLVEGSTLTAVGLLPGTVVQSLNPTLQTIQMSAPAQATASAVPFIGNRGNATYTPTNIDTSVPGLYNCECSIHWDAQGTNVQKVPNAKANNPQIQIDASITGITGE